MLKPGSQDCTSGLCVDLKTEGKTALGIINGVRGKALLGWSIQAATAMYVGESAANLGSASAAIHAVGTLIQIHLQSRWPGERAFAY